MTPLEEPLVSMTLAPNASGDTSVTIRDGHRRITSHCKPDETLLDAVRRTSASITTGCERGDCGACMVMLHQGSVCMRRNAALSEDDIEDGYVLACQAVPTTEAVDFELL